MDNNKVLEEMFKSMEIITDEKIRSTSFTTAVAGRIIERIQSSDMYKISYQNEEIRALAMGGASYSQGDVVYILIPDKRMDNLKFILGRTNDRTPTITTSQTGELSPEILGEIQKALEVINDISSDSRVSPNEKTMLALQRESIQKTYAGVMSELPSHPDINAANLVARYKELQKELDFILEDMSSTTPYSGEKLRKVFGDYYEEEQKVRRSINISVANRSTYKVEILSSNGLLFIGNIVSTTFTAKVYKGDSEITASLEEKNFKWRKTNFKGEEDLEWNRTHSGVGNKVVITEKDLIGRATFTCEIHID